MRDAIGGVRTIWAECCCVHGNLKLDTWVNTHFREHALSCTSAPSGVFSGGLLYWLMCLTFSVLPSPRLATENSNMTSKILSKLWLPIFRILYP